MYEQELEILQGTIAAVVFQNYDNGYSVLRLNLENGQTATVVGTIPLPCMGERLMVTGKWSSHASYGKQFEAEFLERMMPQSANEILTYLSGRVIKGIGPRIAARIVQRFGDDTLRIMEREPERLAEVSGITDKRAMEIGAAGSHNLLMIGPPGSGKSMLARRLPSILPDLTPQEALECTKIHSVAGTLSSGDSVRPTTPCPPWLWRAAAPSPVPARFPWPTTGCSFWTSCPSSTGMPWKSCGSPSRTAPSRCPGWPVSTPIPVPLCWSVP